MQHSRKLIFFAGLMFSILAFLLLPLLVYVPGQRGRVTDEEIEPAVAIVFGAGLKADGTPSDALHDRLIVAAHLLNSGQAVHILVSGDNRFENYNEPQVMQDVLINEFGIPVDLISVDFAGRRTYDTCIRAHTLWGVPKAILVTQNYHLPRAIWTCEQVGMPSVGVSASLQTYAHGTKFKLREILAMYKALIDIYIWPPKYVGGQAETLLEAEYVE